MWLSPPKNVCFKKMGASNSKSPRKALPHLARAICPSLNQSLWTTVLLLARSYFCAHHQGPTLTTGLLVEKKWNPPLKKHGCYKGSGTLGRQKMWEARSLVPQPFPKPVSAQCSLFPSNFIFLLSHPQLQSGIGRLILKEEMKARSSSYADPWTPPRSSTSSREALHTAGYDVSLNGCKHCPGACW